MTIRSICFLSVTFLAAAGMNVYAAQDQTNDHSGNANGEFYVSVSPEEAYIWVDGKPASHRSSSMHLTAGEHKIAVYNYGFQPQVHDVNITADKYQEMTVHLQPVDAPVSGPWGRIQIEGVP